MAKYRFDQIAINSTEKKKPAEEDRFTYKRLFLALLSRPWTTISILPSLNCCFSSIRILRFYHCGQSASSGVFIFYLQFFWRHLLTMRKLRVIIGA